MMMWVLAAQATEAIGLGGELPPPEVELRFEVAGRAFALIPENGVSRGFALSRSRFLGRIDGAYGTSARVAFLTARSGGEAGYIGIAGESIVPVLQLAEARWDVPEIGLAVAGGMVDDLWAGLFQPTWGLPGIAPELGMSTGLIDRSDLGGWIAWSAPDRRVSATVAVLSGEGAARRERNNGVDVSGRVSIRAVDTDDLTVRVDLYGKEGSRGIAKARNHRVAAAITGTHRLVAAGAQSVVGWGQDGDGERAPFAVGAFARTGAEVPFVAYGRVDYRVADRGDADTGSAWFRVGGGPKLPLKNDAPAWIGVGWEGIRHAPSAGPVLGTSTTSHQLFIQLNVDVRARASLAKEA